MIKKTYVFRSPGDPTSLPLPHAVVQDCVPAQGPAKPLCNQNKIG